VQTINIHEAKTICRACLNSGGGRKSSLQRQASDRPFGALDVHRKSVSLVCSKANLMSG